MKYKDRFSWRKFFPWFLAAMPILAGGLAWLLMSGWGYFPDPVVYMRFSLGVAFLFLGGLVSLVALVGLAAVHWMQLDKRRSLEREHSVAAAAHKRFLLRLDHELKNPLTALQVELANLEALLFPPKTPEESGSIQSLNEEHPLQRLRAQIRRLADLSTGLRKLAELETHTIERETVDLDRLLHDLIAENNSSGREQRLSLDLPENPWQLPPVLGDADLLELALRNVLDNAVKYTNPVDAIKVRAFEDGSWIMIEIIDGGLGIPESEQDQVWDELFRGKDARGTPGSGLGLALVRAVIQKHGGQCMLRSQVGRGTRVTLRLPVGV